MAAGAALAWVTFIVGCAGLAFLTGVTIRSSEGTVIGGEADGALVGGEVAQW